MNSRSEFGIRFRQLPPGGGRREGDRSTQRCSNPEQDHQGKEKQFIFFSPFVQGSGCVVVLSLRSFFFVFLFFLVFIVVCGLCDQVSYARPSSETIKGANLYVSGMPKSWTQAELENLFAPYGKIITSRILCDNLTGRFSFLPHVIGTWMEGSRTYQRGGYPSVTFMSHLWSPIYVLSYFPICLLFSPFFQTPLQHL